MGMSKSEVIFQFMSSGLVYLIWFQPHSLIIKQKEQQQENYAKLEKVWKSYHQVWLINICLWIWQGKWWQEVDG